MEIMNRSNILLLDGTQILNCGRQRFQQKYLIGPVDDDNKLLMYQLRVLANIKAWRKIRNYHSSRESCITNNFN